jgi:hypothetical protein
MRAQVAVGLALAGCAYQPGSFHSIQQPFAGKQATFGCLDLAVERRDDLPSGSAVVSYAFGNRCDHPAVVDLATIAVVGRTTDGRQLELTAFDPRHEISVMRIDGRAVGREAIAYPVDEPLSEVCIDAGSIARWASEQWMCFASRPQLTEVP